tara:strand:- start:2044 stop:3468 length:1425 start_codon:yes stop_codon:yes gene_type:complete
MTDQKPPSLYVAREPIFPRRVKGKFRNLKWWIMGVTLMIYYLTPIIRWDRGPSLPDQAVLIDLANRRFYFFWIEIWPHEFYFVAGLLIMAGLGLFLFTSALGRVWCGYTCPQTVWTDLFILVERWIEGDRNARVRLWNADWSVSKVRKRVTKWAVWLIISLLTGGAWVFYFADAPTLAWDLVTLNANTIAYTTIAILTATTFTFGGLLREQVCNYMCPWPRIQAAMMDDQTLTVAYRYWRGEPRGKKHENTTGDCIDCMACVNVCPAGIDIRDGQQMECLTCALCIDACDDVMDRIGKPRGLIDYLALSDEPIEKAGGKAKPIWKHVLRSRTIIYTAMWSLIGVGLIWALFVRSDIELSVEPVRNPLYVQLSDGGVRNTYNLRVRNKTGEDRLLRVILTSDAVLRVDIEGDTDNSQVITVPADETFAVRAYVIARSSDKAATDVTTELRLWVEDVNGQSRASKATIFHGKGASK